MNDDNDQPTGADDALAIEVDNYGLMQAEVQRLQSERNQLASDYCDVLKDIERLKARAYPHMCQDEHIQIGHADSEHEMCPLCREIAKSEVLRDELTASEADRDSAEEDCLALLSEFDEAQETRDAAWRQAIEEAGYAPPVGPEDVGTWLLKEIGTTEADRNHAIASLVAASSNLAAAGFKGETVREQVASVVARVAELESDLLAERRAHGSTQVNLKIATAQLEEAEHHAKRYSIEYDRAKADADEAKADNARLRQQAREIGEKVKAKAITLLEYQCEMAEENHAEFGVCNGIQIALNTINSSLDLAACGAKAEETESK